jgi:ankyrin repeat protein
MVKLLLEYGGGMALLMRDESDGYTPLHIACRQRNVEIGKVLLEYGESEILRLQSDDGSTPLHLACHFSCRPLIELFLRKGGLSLVHIEDEDGETPFDAAGHNSAMLAFLSRLSDPSASVKERYLAMYLSVNARVTCSVCLEDFQNKITVLNCGHFVCDADFERLIDRDELKCPECRRPFGLLTGGRQFPLPPRTPPGT